MDILDSLKRFINKKGVNYVITYLSGDIDDHFKKELEKVHVFVNGSLNRALIHSLV